MTRSITEPTFTRPVLRRLAEVLAAQPEPDIGAQAGTGPVRHEPASLHRLDAAAPAMADRVLRAATEILCGRRAPEQLATVLRPDQLAYLVGLRAATRPLRPRVQSVYTQQPAPGVLEATAVVVLRTGVRALSARFEIHVGTDKARWQCSALHLPLTRGDVAAVQRFR